MSNNTNIKFIYIGNTRTSSKIGEYPKENDKLTYEEINKIFEKASVLSNTNEVVKFGNSKDKDTYILLNPTNNTLFYTITTPNYKKEFVVELFGELEKQSIHLLVDTEGKLNNSGKKSLKSLVDSFQGKTDIIQDLNNDIEGVKIELRENINKQIANNEQSEDLSRKAESLKNSANDFKGNANNLQKKTCIQNCKWNIILAVIIIAVLLAIIVPIIVNANSGSTDSSDNNNSNKRNLRFLDKGIFW